MRKSDTGRLGVFRLIESSPLKEDEQNSLFSLLEQALLKRVEHPWLPRKAGASFNPLPARLIEILLREAKLYDLATCSEALRLVLALDPIGEMESHLLSKATLALSLDIARHLHQASMPSEYLEKAVETLKGVREHYAQKETDRLFLLFKTALERFLKNRHAL